MSHNSHWNYVCLGRVHLVYINVTIRANISDLYLSYTYSMGTDHVIVLTSRNTYSSLMISFRLLMTEICTALTVLLNTELGAYNWLSLVTLCKQLRFSLLCFTICVCYDCKQRTSQFCPVCLLMHCCWLLGFVLSTAEAELTMEQCCFNCFSVCDCCPFTSCLLVLFSV